LTTCIFKNSIGDLSDGYIKVLNPIKGIPRIYHPVIHRRINTNRDIILGDNVLPLQIHHINLHIDHRKTLCARVDIMKPWLDCFEVPSELLVDAFVALRHYLVRVVDETTAHAWHPCSHAPAHLAPTHHALAIKGNLIGCVVNGRKLDVFWFAIQTLVLLYHRSECILLP
jgi:hypothetical protein